MGNYHSTKITITPDSGAVKALKLRQLFKCGTESEILHEGSPDHEDLFEKWCPAEST